MQCTYVKANNEQCQANAMKGAEYCFTHNPQTREQHAAAVLAGGKNSSRKDVIELEPLQLHNPDNAIDLLEQTINGVRDGSIPPNIANTIGYLVGHLLKAIEAADLDKRLESIERVIFERKTVAKRSK